MELVLERPVKNKNEDRLNRSIFASNIAKTIKQYKEIEGLTLGINGEWGAGKTSIIEMIKEDIRIDNESNYVVIDFNPWLFSSRKQLIVDFFKEFSICMKDEDSEDKEKLIKDLLIYSNLFIEVVTIFPQFSIMKLLKKPLKFIEQKYTKNTKSLKEVKESINKNLLNSKKKILIVIDDIDRLEDTEIKEVFKLVRTVGDFNNVVYLLSYHEQNIKKVYDGENYLEKIINIPINIPEISTKVLNDFFINEINKMYTEKVSINTEYWDKIYPLIFENNFNNFRELKRFLNYLKFMSGPIIYEINLIDYLIINFFQYFEIKIYNFIKNNQNQLTSSSSQKIIEKFSKENEIKENYKKTLIILFTKSKITLHDRHIYQKKYFRSYFQCALSDFVFTVEEVNNYLKINNHTQLLNKVNEYETNKLLNNFNEIYFRLTEKNIYEYIKFFFIKSPQFERQNIIKNDHIKGLAILKSLIEKAKDSKKILKIIDEIDFINKYEIEYLFDIFNTLYQRLEVEKDKKIITKKVKLIIHNLEFSRKILNLLEKLKNLGFNIEDYIRKITTTQEDLINYLRILEETVAIHIFATDHDEHGNEIAMEEAEETAIILENITDYIDYSYLKDKIEMLNDELKNKNSHLIKLFENPLKRKDYEEGLKHGAYNC